MFKNNGINITDLERMKRNYSTEVVNSNIPAAMSTSTNAQPLGDNIIYREVNNNILEEIDSGYKSLTQVIVPSSYSRSNIRSEASPFRDLRTLNEDPTKLSGIIVSYCGGFSYTQVSASVTLVMSRIHISQTARTTVYFRVFCLDQDDIIQWTMINSATIAPELREAGSNNRINLSLNYGAVTNIKDKILFGVFCEDYEGDTFPSSLQVNRFQANLISYIRKDANTKP